jgi:hypothetical protein
MVAITARYIDPSFQIREYLLAFENLIGSHSGEYLATTLLDVLNTYDITNKLGCITSDNASNNAAMTRELQRKLRAIGIEWDPSTCHIPYMAHIVNLCVQHFMETIFKNEKEIELEHQASPIKTILEKIRRIGRAHRAGQLRQEKWVKCCESYDLKPLSIPSDVAVRWNSTYDMIERACYLRQPIERYCFELRKELIEYNLTEEEWEEAQLLLLILCPFKRCTMRFESQMAKTEIDYIFFAYDTLYNHVDDVRDIFTDPILQKSLPSAIYLLDAIKSMEETMRKYYARTALPTVYGDAMILNPRYKLSIFTRESWDGEDPAPYIEGCHRRFLERYCKSINPSPKLSTQQKELSEPSRRAYSINSQKDVVTDYAADQEYLEAM